MGNTDEVSQNIEKLHMQPPPPPNLQETAAPAASHTAKAVVGRPLADIPGPLSRSR